MKSVFTFFTALLCAYSVMNAQACFETNLSQNTNNNVSGHTNAGQSFTASCTGSIISVTVTYNALPSSGTNLNDRVLNIYDGGVCGTTLLHTQVIPINSIVLGPNVFTLTTPVPIVMGEVNAWEISDATQSADAGRGVSFNGGGLYSGGDAWYSCSVISGFDQTFEVQIGSAGPSVDLGQDTTVCVGQSVTLDAGNPGGTFLWSTSATTQSITVNTLGSYWVNVTDTSGNTATDTIVVTNFPSSQVNLGPDQNQCPGDTVCVNAGSGSGFAWNTGATTASICTNVSGIFSVTVLDSNGCSSGDSVEVVAVPNPIVNLGADQDICRVDSICLTDGSSGLTYLWNNGSTSNTLCTNMAGNYWLMTTDSNGCSASDSVAITANQLAVAFVGSCDTANCPTIDFTDGSTNAIDWAWDFGDGNTSTLQNPSNTYATNGTYQALLTASNNCNSDTVSKSLVINCLIRIDEGFSANVAVYPNPNSGVFQVRLSDLPLGNVELKLMTLTGQLIESRQWDSQAATRTETFEIPNLSQGVYLLDIEVASKHRSEKIFIRK